MTHIVFTLHRNSHLFLLTSPVTGYLEAGKQETPSSRSEYMLIKNVTFALSNSLLILTGLSPLVYHTI